MNKMIKKIMMTMAAAMTVMLIASCRDKADDVKNYGVYDAIDFMDAGNSFEGEFKNLWIAMNTNYGIWDYEAEHGLNRDDVYDKYLPKMQELDKRDKDTNPVTNDEFQALYNEILSPLHDGHFYCQVKNLHTGDYVAVSPSDIRNASRPDFNIKQVPAFDYYLTAAAGENYIDPEDFFDIKVTAADYIQKEVAQVNAYVDYMIDSLSNLPAPTDLDNYFLNKFKNAKQEFNSLDLGDAHDVKYYNNTLTTKYADRGIIAKPFDIDDDDQINVRVAAFNDGILYLGFSGFYLSSYLGGYDDDDSSPCRNYYTTLIKKAWASWFYAIQEAHKQGLLKGVIIDVRNNGGGMASDYSFALGALLPSGGHSIGKLRYKAGIGRYDYMPIIDNYMETYSDEHETITEPIVVLTNCNSVSMAEITAQGAKEMDNARTIGKTTWGGLCSLRPNPELYSLFYASAIGIEGKTPFYAYIPNSINITRNGILEGVGIEPDIDVDLDPTLLSQGRDSQLERALQYIRTGN